jgi:leucyl aminopeptidase
MMSQDYLAIPQNITFQLVESITDENVPLITFGFSSGQPVLGEPSKSAGEIILVKDTSVLRILISLGQKEKCTAETFRKSGGQLGKWLLSHPATSLALNYREISQLGIDGAFQAFLEGVRLGAYKFDRYQKQETGKTPTAIKIISPVDNMPINAIIEKVQIVTAAVLLEREWAHEPANVINPITLAERAVALSQQVGIKCMVLDHDDLEALKAGAILAVGKGSNTPARMIVVEYPGVDAPAGTKPIVLVGKALTFDSGGYSLKSTEGIQGMKYDKCGGLTVLATLFAAAQLRIKTPIIGVIAAAENLISANAYRPDDIIISLSGKTIEILSTDAEGRLVLADALTYTQRIYQPAAIIDLATLTGGVVTALGRVRAGVMGNNPALIQDLIASGERTRELLWQLPLDEEYFQQIKGDDADIKNSGGREASPIIGGTFLKQFVDDQIPWAHIDIAGVADSPKDQPYIPKGASGFGIRLLIDYLESKA